MDGTSPLALAVEVDCSAFSTAFFFPEVNLVRKYREVYIPKIPSTTYAKTNSFTENIYFQPRKLTC